MKSYEYMFVGPTMMNQIRESILKDGDGTVEVFNYLGAQGWVFLAEMSGQNFLFYREKN